ncbi:MAG: hypothetical protein QNK19_12625 [Xanthomonadales bacterium]|nr:hypothetical protein [Xanthomonadales bacterium]
MQKPKSVIFLLIWFMWSAGQDLDLLVRHQVKVDFYTFQFIGLTPLFFILATTVFALNIMTIYSLIKPYFVGFYTAIASLAVGLLHSAIGLSLAVNNLQGVREAYQTGREIRGAPIREEAMDMIFTEQGMYYSLASILVFYILVLFFVIKNKTYFYSGSLSA